MSTPSTSSSLLRSASQESLASAYIDVPLDPLPLLPSAPDASSNPPAPVDPKRVTEIKRGAKFATYLAVAFLIAAVAMIILGAAGIWFAPPAGGFLMGLGFLSAVGGITIGVLAEEAVENLDKRS